MFLFASLFIGWNLQAVFLVILVLPLLDIDIDIDISDLVILCKDNCPHLKASRTAIYYIII